MRAFFWVTKAFGEYGGYYWLTESHAGHAPASERGPEEGCQDSSRPGSRIDSKGG